MRVHALTRLIAQVSYNTRMLSRKGTVSLSNTNDVSTESSDGTLPALFASSKPTATGDWELTTFATLPPVSSYLGECARYT